MRPATIPAACAGCGRKRLVPRGTLADVDARNPDGDRGQQLIGDGSGGGGGVFLPGEDAELYAQDIFAQFPQWDAAKNNAWISIAESFYLGPYNPVGIQKLADAIAALG